MCKVFKGDSKEMHDAFQRWRRDNVDGFHMTEGVVGQFTIHYTQDRRENEEERGCDPAEARGCSHQGWSSNEYHGDQDSCYTTARKVCSNSFAELIAWANRQGYTTKNCKHCDSKRFPFPVVKPPEGGGDGGFRPGDVDEREIIERQIRERRGQPQFRAALLARYGERCLVTGCEIPAVLEAAHISSYRGTDDNHPENGLLLRCDIHTLFDLDLIGIEPEQLRVILHPEIAKEYGHFADVALGCGNKQRPSRDALKRRYEQFRQRLGQPTNRP